MLATFIYFFLVLGDLIPQTPCYAERSVALRGLLFFYPPEVQNSLGAILGYPAEQ